MDEHRTTAKPENALSEERVAAALAQLKGVVVDPHTALNHVIRAAHRTAAFSDGGAVEVAGLPGSAAHVPHPPVPGTYALDEAGFIADIQQTLSNVAGGGQPGDVGYVGYQICLGGGGAPATSAVAGSAHWPADGAENWAPSVRQHVAALSANITAMAMIKALTAAGLPADGSTRIFDYLPTYWPVGPNIDNITVADLLTHTSGIVQDTPSTPADFQTIREVIAAGVSAENANKYAYRNVNFALCRVLLATITGAAPVNWLQGSPASYLDALWDLASISHYITYVEDNIFTPAGVHGPLLQHSTGDALAYPFYLSGKGWNSGDLSTGAGADGWHMSAQEVVAVMDMFRRSGELVTPAQAQSMLDASFGIDYSNMTQLGRVYAKRGSWSNATGDTEQSVLFYLPDNLNVVVSVNSQLGIYDADLLTLVYQAYTANIKVVSLLHP